MKIAVFTKNRSNPAYAAARLGADRAAARFGATTKHYVPVKPDDVDEQIALIDQALADKPDGFVVVPVHPTAVNAALRKVYAAGIPLVGLLNRFSEPGPLSYVGADDYAIGVALARYLFRHLGGRGHVVIMEGVPSSVTSNDRVHGFNDALKEFPDVRLVRKIRGDYLREPAKRAASALLREGVRFNAVLAANDDMAIGMMAALDEAGAQATVVSVNAIPEAITAIKEGKLLATVDFNSKDMATIATEALLRHLRGETVPPEIMLPVQIVDRSNYANWDKPFEARPDLSWKLLSPSRVDGESIRFGSNDAWTRTRRIYCELVTNSMDATLVSRDPDIMSGALCFTGTRVPVQNLFDYLEGASSLDDFLEDFPSVSREVAIKVLEQARERLFADAPPA